MRFVKEYFKTVRFRTLGLAILGAVILLGGAVAWNTIYKEPPPEYYISLLLTISTFCMAVSSAYVIKYKEMPRTGGLPSVTGWWALCCGITSLLISGSAFLFFLYEAIIKLFNR